MIGYQILAIEKEDGTFLADKVSAYFSVELTIEDAWENRIEAERIYNLFGRDKKEFKLSLNDLVDICNASSCIEGAKGYHKYACDGVTIIPKTKDKFVPAGTFLGLPAKERKIYSKIKENK